MGDVLMKTNTYYRLFHNDKFIESAEIVLKLIVLAFSKRKLFETVVNYNKLDKYFK
jgi:hypothetical protein